MSRRLMYTGIGVIAILGASYLGSAGINATHSAEMQPLAEHSAATLVVTSVSDSGEGTLRKALQNATYGDTIVETTSFALEGSYTLTLSVTDKDGGSGSDSLVIDVLNRPPDCSAASPSIDTIWPANHKFVPVNVLGVTDPEQDEIAITIESIAGQASCQISRSTCPRSSSVGAARAASAAEGRPAGDSGRSASSRLRSIEGSEADVSSE